jgi:opacity protein-like surface antigen
MKKIFALLSVLSILSIPAFSAEEAAVTSLEAETAEVKNAEENTRALNDFTDFSHWSLSLNVGMSQFDGDVTQKFDQILSASKVSWTIGLEAEYTWNPVWGLLLNFQYMPYQGKTGSTEWGSNSFKGNMYAPSLMASVNLFNLFGQYRKSAAWNMYLNAGVGLIWYECINTPIEGTAPGEKTPKGIGQNGSGYGTAISIPLGLNVEYNINKHFPVALSGYY